MVNWGTQQGLLVRILLCLFFFRDKNAPFLQYREGTSHNVSHEGFMRMTCFRGEGGGRVQPVPFSQTPSD